MTQDEHNSQRVTLIPPDPFTLEYCVSDKNGFDIPCTISGFYLIEFKRIEELTILDEYKNDITDLYNDKFTLGEIDHFVDDYYFNEVFQ